MDIEKENKEKVLASFSDQSQGFSSYISGVDKLEYMQQVIKKLNLDNNESVIEVAAGTGVCSRMIASYVKKVVAYDLTPEMLAEGRKEAEKEKIDNISFIKGQVTEMPFIDNTFDVVITRLSFHHFTTIEEPLAEMYRILKKGGRLIIIDLEAAPELSRELNDKLETLRDPSHTRKRNLLELTTTFEKLGIKVIDKSVTDFEMSLKKWLNLTNCRAQVRTVISSFLNAEINGGLMTGFQPYKKEDELYFIHRWMQLIGEK